jgi:hypothetical protein
MNRRLVHFRAVPPMNDNVLYHSLPGLAGARVQFVGYRGQLIGEFMSDLLRIWLELGCGDFPEPRFWIASGLPGAKLSPMN